MWRRTLKVLLHRGGAVAASTCLRRRPRLLPATGSLLSHVAESPSVRLSTWRACSAAAQPGNCWNCGAASPFLVCADCGSVQPVDDSIDFFQIFGFSRDIFDGEIVRELVLCVSELERKYELGVEELEVKYKDWQKKLHPDLVHTKSQRERSYAADQSARVINAFSTLSKPLFRATYMLQLEGLHVEEEGTITDPGLLSEVMEIRECIEEAKDLQTLEKIKSMSEAKLDTWSKAFGEAFRDRRFEEATVSIRRMTYYQRAIEEIVKKL